MPRRPLESNGNGEAAVTVDEAAAYSVFFDEENSTPTGAAPAQKRRRTTAPSSITPAILSNTQPPTTTNSNSNSAVPRLLLSIEYQESPPAAGTIKSIKLKNFMCHPNVKIDLHNSVTFIHGRNGSGKSAVLAGLVLGLGGKPSSLNRGNTVKEYIRTQNATAEISIVFNNVGPEAYRYDIFGNQLTIERTLSASGRSSYRIKDQQGAIISNRFDEVAPILRCYNFQLDNPVMILTQDTSRTFLSQCNPKKLYEIFYRGTQLKKMDEDFEVVTTNASILDGAVERRKMIIDGLKEEMAEINNQIKSHANAQRNRDRLALLAKAFGWAKYRDADREFSAAEKKEADLRARAEQLSEEITSIQEGETGTEEKKKVATERLEELRRNLDDVRRQMADLQTQYGDSQRRGREKKADREKLEQEIATYAREKSDIIAYIRRVNDQQMNDEKKIQRDKKEAELRDVQQHRVETEAARVNHKTESFQWESSLREHRENEDALRQEIQVANDHLNGARSRLKDLQMAQSNTLARFGPQTPRLTQLIEEAVNRGQFHRRPRGPIGYYVTVKEERYATAIEACLGGPLLCAFVCHDFEDNRKLEELMGKCTYNRRSDRPQIFVRSFGDERSTYDVTQNEARSQNYPNVLSLLNVQDAVIRNLLIDQRRVESVILFDNDQEMREVMRNDPPRNASSAYDLQGGNALLHPTFRFYPPQWQGQSRYLVKSLDEQIARLNEQVNQFQPEKTRLENQLKEIKKKVASEEYQKSRCLRAMEECQKTMINDDRLIRRLEQEIIDLNPETPDNRLLEEELRENDQKSAEASALLQEAISALKVHSVAVRAVHDQLAEKRSEESALQEQIAEQQRVLDRLNGEAGRKRRDIETKQSQLATTNRDIQTASAKTKSQKETAQKLLGEAKELSEDPITDETGTCADIDREMRRLHAYVTRFDQSAVNVQDLMANGERLTARLAKMQGFLDEIEEATDLLHEAIEVRKGGYHTIKTLTGILVKQRFVRNLSGRNYRGKLEINEQKEELVILVEPRDTESSAKGMMSQPAGAARGGGGNKRGRPVGRAHQDLRGLSGGERSYSTVSFIMALWETMNAPCCCLDEFDVFMDHLSRRMIMELLIMFAWKNRPGHQFVFLTPLSVSELPFHAKGLKVFELQAPRDNRRAAKDAN